MQYMHKKTKNTRCSEKKYQTHENYNQSDHFWRHCSTRVDLRARKDKVYCVMQVLFTIDRIFVNIWKAVMCLKCVCSFRNEVINIQFNPTFPNFSWNMATCRTYVQHFKVFQVSPTSAHCVQLEINRLDISLGNCLKLLTRFVCINLTDIMKFW